MKELNLRQEKNISVIFQNKTFNVTEFWCISSSYDLLHAATAPFLELEKYEISCERKWTESSKSTNFLLNLGYQK